MLAVKFDEHFRQAVLANVRGAGEHIFECDFPRDYEWSEGWRADGVRSLSRQAGVTSAGEEGLCTPTITCNVINEVLQYKMFILEQGFRHRSEFYVQASWHQVILTLTIVTHALLANSLSIRNISHAAGNVQDCEI